ncbi:MAG: ABC transporter substrate-binding protein [Acidimicrobiaceae bacterium]|nr:ABC transporter substrate-binding protein [Acidimicrobiaceae bacterium]
MGGFADIPISEAGGYYVSLINCAGGVGGHPVAFIIEDVQGDPEVSQRATADLLDAGAHVILGPPFADTGDAVLQTVNASRAVIFVASTEPVLPDPSIYSFMTTFSDTQQAEAAAEFAIDNGITRAITFSSEGPYFGYNPETFAAKFEELGGELVLDVSYVPFEDFDFASHANEVAGVADGTEILYTAMIAPQLDALRGAIEERGIDSITYFGADAFGVSGITVIDNNEGVYWTDHGFGTDGNRYERLNAGLAAMGMPSEAPGFAALAGDAITVAIQGFIDAGSTDPLAIAEAISQLTGVEAVTDTIGYAGTDGTPDTPVYILQIVNGETTLAARM